MRKNYTFLVLALISTLLIPNHLSIAQTEWVNINGTVTYDGTPLCAMVLANGQYMFTCGDNLGVWDLEVPLDSNGLITLYGFCSGFSPFKTVLTPSEALDFDFTMIRAAAGSREIDITMRTEPGNSKPNWVRISGTVTYDGTPLCAMVLANGQAMFSCGADLGTFDLEVPLDSNGEITLYCFCSGFAPYKADYISVTTGSTGAYPVVDADQTDCFDTDGNIIICGSAYDGQDAQYTTLTPSYTNNGDGTVTDHNTGLVWQRHHSDALTWADGITYCDDLVLGDESNWRMPNIKELYSLMDFDGYTGRISDTEPDEATWKLYLDGSWDTTDDTATFILESGMTIGSRIIDGQIWTTTDPVGGTIGGNDSVLGVNFWDGRIKAYNKTSTKFTKCVCDATTYGENSFEITDDGQTVTDHSTGLMWTRAYSNDTIEFPEVLEIDSNDAEYGGMVWADALFFCEGLDYAGYTDWKLPDIKELHTIVKNPEVEGDPAIDTDFFYLDLVELPDYCNDTTFTSYPYFWSSTTHKEYHAPSSTPALGNIGAYIAFGKGWGSMDGGVTWIDVHAPGCQRSDPKDGDPSNYACGRGPQGDYISIYNFVRCVRKPETADFSATPAAVNEGDTVSFTDLSTGSPISWSWTFEGGTPSSSTDQNPIVTYNTGGSYAVTLTTNYAGRSVSETKTDSITVTATSGVYGGYMLMPPMRSYTTYLVDTDGSIAKTWTSSYRGEVAYLLEDTTMLRTGKLANGNRFASTGGSGAIVERYDWSGNVIWSYQQADDTACLHHDIEYLPNGNILMIVWEYKSATEAEDAGRNPSLLADGELWPDKVIEVDPTDDSIVWEWHVWDHLIQDYDSSKDNYGVVADHPELIDLNYVKNPTGIADWNHINAIDYNAELDQIILSSHSFQEFWVIDHSTTTAEAASHSGGTYGKGGDILYRWGNPATYGASGDQKFFGQHDANWIPSGTPGAGNILVFNNGQGRPEGSYSTVDEIVPDVNPGGSYPVTVGQAFGPSSQEWIYNESGDTSFYGQNISGAQRLPNGNTLICEGPNGYIFEVTYDGTVVWTYQNTDGTTVFRVYKYPYDYPGLGF